MAILVVSSLPAGEPPNPRYTGMMSQQEWTREETGGFTGNFAAVQARDTGFIYVANRNGVLEYDGVRWRRLPLPADQPAAAVRCVLVDEMGRIWAGLDNEVLRYTADESGLWQPERMLNRLPEPDRQPGVVGQLMVQAGRVWAAATGRVMAFDLQGTGAKSWPTAAPLRIVGAGKEAPLFCQAGHVLLELRADGFAPAEFPVLPAGTQALSLGRSGTGVWQAEHPGGVLELRGEAWVPLSAELAQSLAGAAQAGNAVRLADGRRIFSTNSGKLFFVGADGHVLGIVGEDQGIFFGGLHQTYLDRDGGLWIASASGIKRVQVDGAVAQHGRGLGLRGAVFRLALDDTTLWALGAEGFFRRDPATGRFERAAHFGQTWAALPGPDGRWILGGTGFLKEWTPAGDVNLPGKPGSINSVIRDPADSNLLYAGTVNEVRVYRKTAAGWRAEAVVGGVNGNLDSLAMDDAGTLWLGATTDGLWRVEPGPGRNWAEAKPERMDGGSKPAGAPLAARWRVERIAGEVVSFGLQGVWREDPATGQMEPDARFAGLPEGAKTPLFRLAAGRTEGVIYLSGDGDYGGRVWRGVRAARSEAWQFSELALSETKRYISGVDFREASDGKTLWVGGLVNTVSLDLTAPPTPDFPAPAAVWRGVKALEGDEVFLGGARRVDAFVLPVGQRALKLEYSAPALRLHIAGNAGLEFRTRAVGLDRGWSAWARVDSRELTNLPAGRIRLEVQARNHLRAEGPVAALVLTVPPFWWETWWFRTLAGLIVAALVAAPVRWLVRRQFQQRIALLEAQAAVQQERLRIARDMHDDLGSTLASIVHLSDQSASPGPAAPILARVHEAARDLVQRTRDIVWAATPQHDSLESLIEQMASHAERMLGDRGIAVKVDLPAQVPEEAMPSAVRHDVFLAFKEAVNNAAKYSRASDATVRVALERDVLVIEIADDGVGFAAGEVRGTGHGLPNLRERLAAIGGRADITSAPGRGTNVTLRVPRAARKA